MEAYFLWAEECVDSLDREWPGPPTASLHAWPFKTVMLSHVICRPAGNHLLKAGTMVSPYHSEKEKEKNNNKGKHNAGWSGRVLVLTGLCPACLTFTHKQTDGHMPPRGLLLLSDTSHERAPQLAVRGFCSETWSSEAKNNMEQVWGRPGIEAPLRSAAWCVCVLTRTWLLIQSPAMFNPTSGYYVMFVSVTPWLLRLF